MRAILWFGLVIGFLWAGYWFVGSRAVEQETAAWFAGAASRGLEASNQGIAVAGFPNRFDLTLTEPRLADPATGWGWRAPFAQVFSMTWKPWHLIAALPNQQTIQAPGEEIALASSKLQASLRFHPSSDLALAELVVEGRDLTAASERGWVLGAKSLVFGVIEDTTQRNSQRLGLDLTDFTPDPALTALLPELGPVVSTLHLDATLQLSAPLDRRVGETGLAIEAIRLADFNATWGSLKISAKGSVTASADGFAEGRIEFVIENWREVFTLLAAMGLVDPGQAESFERGFEVLAKAGGDAEKLDLPLEFKDGQMLLGPLPMGRAPRLN